MSWDAPTARTQPSLCRPCCQPRMPGPSQVVYQRVDPRCIQCRCKVRRFADSAASPSTDSSGPNLQSAGLARSIAAAVGAGAGAASLAGIDPSGATQPAGHSTTSTPLASQRSRNVAGSPSTVAGSRRHTRPPHGTGRPVLERAVTSGNCGMARTLHRCGKSVNGAKWRCSVARGQQRR